MKNQGQTPYTGNGGKTTPVFPKFARPIALALGIALLSACAKPSYVSPVSVTRFASEDPSQLGHGTISVAPSAATASDSIEQGLFAAEIASELEALGYTVVDADADQLATFTLTQTVNRTNGRGPVSVGGGGVVGSRGSGVGLGIGINLSGPDPDEISTQLSVSIRPATGGDNLWEGRASASATSNSPLAETAATADRMASALFSGFPGVSGETIQVK